MFLDNCAHLIIKHDRNSHPRALSLLQTLGGSGMRQKIDKITGVEEKRFYLQYTFPPSCVGETGRVGAPGRREIGHGNLAER